MHTRTWLIALWLLCSSAVSAAAADQAAKPEPYICPLCHVANNQGAPYPQKAGAGLLRGVANTALGWTELVVQPTAEVKANGNLLMGLGKGMGYAITRTGAGIGELFTFWVPRGKDGYLSLTKDCPICLRATPTASGASTASVEPAKSSSR